MVKNLQVVEEIISTLVQHFEGIEVFLGEGFNFDLLEQEISLCDNITSSLNSSPALSSEIAVCLIEAGLFEARVYSGKEVWNPLTESLKSFVKNNPSVKGYRDCNSSPGLGNVKNWVDEKFTQLSN